MAGRSWNRAAVASLSGPRRLLCLLSPEGRLQQIRVCSECTISSTPLHSATQALSFTLRFVAWRIYASADKAVRCREEDVPKSQDRQPEDIDLGEVGFDAEAGSCSATICARRDGRCRGHHRLVEGNITCDTRLMAPNASTGAMLASGSAPPTTIHALFAGFQLRRLRRRVIS